MKRILTYSITVVALLFNSALFGALYGQESHVQRRYFKDIKMTVVTSDSLYVVNIASQFMQLQIRGRYPSQEQPPKQMPEKIWMDLYAYTTEPLYREDQSHHLLVKADEEILDLGLMGYSIMQESGKDTYSSDPNLRLAIQSPIPADALVRTAHSGNHLFLESMSVPALPLSQLARIAKANKVLVKVGKIVFSLSETQKGILREFAASITPANFTNLADLPATPAVTASIPADVPSDANNASLDVTMNWLKKELPRNSSSKGLRIATRLENVEVSGCQVKYRETPLVTKVPGANTLVYTITDYELNLADLNPESVRISDSKDYSIISFATRDQVFRIKRISKANDDGMAGRVLGEKLEASGSFLVRDAAAAAQIQAALKHAITLCKQ